MHIWCRQIETRIIPGECPIPRSNHLARTSFVSFTTSLCVRPISSEAVVERGEE